MRLWSDQKNLNSWKSRGHVPHTVPLPHSWRRQCGLFSTRTNADVFQPPKPTKAQCTECNYYYEMRAILINLFACGLYQTNIRTRVQDYCRQRQHQCSQNGHRRLFPKLHRTWLPIVLRCPTNFLTIWHLNIKMQLSTLCLRKKRHPLYICDNLVRCLPVLPILGRNIQQGIWN